MPQAATVPTSRGKAEQSLTDWETDLVSRVSRFAEPVIVERDFSDGSADFFWVVIVDGSKAEPKTVQLNLENRHEWVIIPEEYKADQPEKREKMNAIAQQIVDLAEHYAEQVKGATAEKPSRFFMRSETIDQPIVHRYGR